MSVEELQAKYLEGVGRATGSDDRRYLIWKIREAEKGRIPVGPRPMSPAEHEKRRLVEWLRAELARATGRRYRIELDVESLRELQRLLRDLDHETQATVNRARLMPWTR